MPLSNTTLITLSSAPYWDDFQSDKRFHRILNRPRVAVQTRELNQVQSMMQHQIEQLATARYLEGTAVQGGGQSFANNALALQLVRDDATDIANFFDTTIGVGTIANGSISGAQGRVVQYARQVGETNTAVVIVSSNDKKFTANERVFFTDSANTSISKGSMLVASGTSATRPAVVYSVDQGVFFLRGHMVEVPSQTVVLSTSSATPSARIGFTIAEEIITELDDTSLLDPALGTSNYSAPGAHRLRLTATLTSVSLDSTNANFVEIARVINGNLITEAPQALENPITEDTLARRTYDESGDYVVRPFTITTSAHNPPTNVPNANGTISGTTATTSISSSGIATRFLSEVSVNDQLVVNGEKRTVIGVSSDSTLTVNLAFNAAFTNVSFTVIKADLMNVDLGAGKAYVRGYEFETLGTTKLQIPRARTTRSITDGQTSTFFGPYVTVTRDAGLFDTTTAEKVDLHCVQFANTTANTGGIINTSASAYAASKIGTARVRSLVYDSGVGDANTLHSLYLVGAEFETKTYQVQVTANSDTRLTAALVCNTTDGSVTLTQNATSADTFILPRASHAFNGTTLQLRDIYNVPLNYTVIGSNVEATTESTTSIKLYLGTTRFFESVNTTANVVVVFNDKALRSVATSIAKSAGATVAVDSRVGRVVAGNTMMMFPEYTAALFKFRESWVNAASITNVSYSTMYRFDSVSPGTPSGGNTPFTANLPDAGMVFEDVQPTRPYVTFTVTNSSNQIVSLRNATVSASGGSATLSIPTADVGTGAIKILAKVLVGTSVTTQARTKALFTANTNVQSVSVSTSTGIIYGSLDNLKGHIAINNNVNAISQGFSTNVAFRVIGLGVHDVTALQKVYAVVKSTDTSTWVDVTSRYDLDTGQRSWAYDHASIVLKPGYAHFPTANQMVVMVDRYNHTGTSGYFTGKSYTNISIENIPTFTDPISGAVYPLRDYADFRYARPSSLSTANTAYNPYVGATQTFSAQNTFPHPDESFEADYAHYLPRIDKVVLTRDKILKVILGQSSVTPVAPNDPEDGIVLYTLHHGAYTPDPTMVQVEAVDHRRYTMRDIARLEKRIERLEYYAQLSQLEDRTLNTPELDDDDLERFKNGILIDPFASHAVADVTDTDYRASIDERNRELRPAFISNGFGLARVVRDNSTANTVKNATLVTLSYTSTPFISQPLASKSVNVNPYGVASWRGRIVLTPGTDVWMDTVTLPSAMVNLAGENDNWETIGFGTVWGEWNDVWAGTPTTQVTSSVAFNTFGFATDPRDGVTRIAEIRRSIDAVTSTQTGTSQRSGTSIVAKNSRIETDLGERVVDMAIAPTMRSRDIAFVASGLLPGANLSAFFDETDVSAYVERASEIQLASSTAASAFIVGETIESNVSSSSAVVVGIYGDTLRVVSPKGTFYATSPTVGIRPTFPSSFRDTAVTAYTPVSGYTSWGGQVIAATTSTITLDAGASSALNAYVGETINIVKGPGVGQKSTITAYDNSGKIATISPPFPSSNLPVANSSRYAIGRVVVDPLTTGIANSSRRPGYAYGMFYLPGVSIATGSNGGLANGWRPLAAALSTPPLQFKTGNRVFRLSDMPSSALAATSAETVYQATGTTKTVQSTTVSTRSVSFETQTVTDQRTISRNLGTTLQSTATPTGIYLDPLAQTFVVEGASNQYPQGVFITNVQLFFAKKDQSGLEITVQIRPTVNGFPSADEVLGSATLTSGEVKVVPEGITPSPSNANHATTFTFADPVYLMPGVEYAIVILSNSFNYEVFVGEIGQKVIGESAQIIAQQPYAGSFFKSQNSRTWTPQQEEDLMFVLNRAAFTTNPATAKFQLSDVASNTVVRRFTNSAGDFDYDVYNIQTGHIDFRSTADKTLIYYQGTQAVDNAAVAAVSTNEDENIALSTRHRLRTGNASSVQIQVSMQTANGHVSPVFDVDRLSLIAVKNIIDDGGLYANGFMIINPGATTSVPITETNVTLAITGTDAAGITSGNGAIVTMKVNTSGKVETFTLSNTGSGYIDTVTVNAIPSGHGISWATTPQVIYRSEVLNSVGIIGEEKARYITRRVNLAEGFDARDLKVYVSANRPPGTNIDVYYKVLATGDKENFADKSWTRMPLNPDQVNTFAASARQFREYEYRTRNNVAEYSSNGVTYDRFNTFAIKIVLRSSTTTVVPRLRNLRAIALDT